MKRRKILGILSFIMLILLVILFFNNKKHGFVLGDFILAKMGINAWSDGTSGLHYTGVVTSILLILVIVGIVSFKKDVHEKFGKFVMIFIIVGAILYQPAYDSVYGFVKSNMKGLASVEYIRDNSRISFESSNNIISFDGQIELKNYSNEVKEFYIKIPVEPAGALPANLKEITIRNSSNEATKFIIEPQRETNFKVKFSVKQSDSLGNSGGNIIPDIIIFNETEEKKLLANTY